MASTFAKSVSTPRCSHQGDPGLVEKGYILSDQVEDVRSVRVVGTRALDVSLARKLVSERPPHSIDDKPTLDPEDDVLKEAHSACLTDVATYPSSGGRIGLEKTRERSTALPRIEVNRPARDIADHLLLREFVALKLSGRALFTGQKRDQRAIVVKAISNSSSCNLSKPTTPGEGAGHSISLPARLDEIARENGVAREAIEVWFADEARVGQKDKITRRWAKRGTRPSAPKDQRTASADERRRRGVRGRSRRE